MRVRASVGHGREDGMDKDWLPWLVGMPVETTLAITSMIFSGVFENPSLRVAFAHGGGSFPATVARIQRVEVRPTCARWTTTYHRRTLGRFWLDSLVHDPVVLQYLVDPSAADKVALGTDYPVPAGRANWNPLIRACPAGGANGPC